MINQNVWSSAQPALVRVGHTQAQYRDRQGAVLISLYA
jgi:hypothetical protein